MNAPYTESYAFTISNQTSIHPLPFDTPATTQTSHFTLTIETPKVTCNKKGLSKHTCKLLKKMGR